MTGLTGQIDRQGESENQREFTKAIQFKYINKHKPTLIYLNIA